MATMVEKAQAVLVAQMNPRYWDKALRLVEDGKAEWVVDPMVDNVVGLIETGTNTALVVVYIKTPQEFSDWEASEEFEASVW